MVMQDEIREQYGITAEENESDALFANKMFEAYKVGTLSKPQVLEEIACKARNKYNAAMIAMFVGYLMSETG